MFRMQQQCTSALRKKEQCMCERVMAAAANRKEQCVHMSDCPFEAAWFRMQDAPLLRRGGSTAGILQVFIAQFNYIALRAKFCSGVAQLTAARSEWSSVPCTVVFSHIPIILLRLNYALPTKVQKKKKIMPPTKYDSPSRHHPSRSWKYLGAPPMGTRTLLLAPAFDP